MTDFLLVKGLDKSQIYRVIEVMMATKIGFGSLSQEYNLERDLFPIYTAYTQALNRFGNLSDKQDRNYYVDIAYNLELLSLSQSELENILPILQFAIKKGG